MMLFRCRRMSKVVPPFRPSTSRLYVNSWTDGLRKAVMHAMFVWLRIVAVASQRRGWAVCKSGSLVVK